MSQLSAKAMDLCGLKENTISPENLTHLFLKNILNNLVMSIYNYESRMNSFQKSKYPVMDKNASVKDISDINAYSSPKQISQFVASKMKEFIQEQLDDKIKTEEK